MTDLHSLIMTNVHTHKWTHAEEWHRTECKILGKVLSGWYQIIN